jgi:hypothetical protein
MEAPAWLDKKAVDSILELMASHPGCREEVWGVFQHYLPTTIAEYGEQDTIVRSGLLQSVIVAEVLMKKTEYGERDNIVRSGRRRSRKFIG